MTLRLMQGLSLSVPGETMSWPEIMNDSTSIQLCIMQMPLLQPFTSGRATLKGI